MSIQFESVRVFACCYMYEMRLKIQRLPLCLQRYWVLCKWHGERSARSEKGQENVYINRSAYSRFVWAKFYKIWNTIYVIECLKKVGLNLVGAFFLIRAQMLSDRPTFNETCISNMNFSNGYSFFYRLDNKKKKCWTKIVTDELRMN